MSPARRIAWAAFFVTLAIVALASALWLVSQLDIALVP